MLKSFLSASAACAFTLALAGCSGTMPTLGGASNMSATGGAGGSSSQGANAQLEHCATPFGTLGVDEDRATNWYSVFTARYPQLGSTIPVLRLMIQQSNCFVVVERGSSFNNMMRERKLKQSDMLREGSNYRKHQMVAADYTMSPSIHFSKKGTGGAGAIIGGLLGTVGSLVAGGLKSNEASTTLLLIDNRSGVQIAAATGSAKNFDFNLFGGMFYSGVGGGAGAYTDTPQGKVITAAFVDSYNQMVRALRNYQAQSVNGGLGTGGTLDVAQ